MGREVCRAVVGDADLELVAAVDPSHAGQVVEGSTLAGSLDALTDAGAEVVVEFTRPEAASSNIAWCI
ncbi:MAG: 4-hydroxy-tetrahydrodipicolinate reductase, partial [Actinomycetota bacterium]